jgi:hypothetical protein
MQIEPRSAHAGLLDNALATDSRARVTDYPRSMRGAESTCGALYGGSAFRGHRQKSATVQQPVRPVEWPVRSELG